MTLLLFLDAWTIDARFKIWSKFDFFRGQLWSNAVKCGQTRLLIFILCKCRSNCRFSPNHIFQVTQNQSTYTFFDYTSLADRPVIHFFSECTGAFIRQAYKYLHNLQFVPVIRTQIEPYHFQCYVKELYLLTFRGFRVV